MDTADIQIAPQAEEAVAGRHAAGQDPAKRRRILEGASRVFQASGFDAASMNDITQAAGVSKGTLYVYFQNKEQLFIALIDEERERFAAGLFEQLDDEVEVGTALRAFGRKLASLVTQDRITRAKRIVIGVSERMPELGRSFYLAGPGRSTERLADYLDRQVARGRLVIPDTRLAAAQLLDLCQSTLVPPRMFGHDSGQASEADVTRVVDSAVTMFMATYSPR